MIFYLATHPHQYTIRWFLEDWAPELRDRITVRSYDEARRDGAPDQGTYVFADIERLSGTDLEKADRLWLRLAGLGDGVRLLNRPLRTWRRVELLRRLHAEGTNSFRGRRLAARPVRPLLDGAAGAALARGADVRGVRRLTCPLLRFPVFLRSTTEHDGSLSPLLHGWSDLRDAARELVREGRDASDLLVVEFCDTSDADGLFRKYGAFVIGERIVPRGMMFSTHWVVKEEDVESPELMREQRDYLETNPHASWIGALARRAGVGYGRVDYALRHGQPQVWEINTNPTVVTARDTVKPADVPLVESMVRPIARALESIDR